MSFSSFGSFRVIVLYLDKAGDMLISRTFLVQLLTSQCWLIISMIDRLPVCLDSLSTLVDRPARCINTHKKEYDRDYFDLVSCRWILIDVLARFLLGILFGNKSDLVKVISLIDWFYLIRIMGLGVFGSSSLMWVLVLKLIVIYIYGSSREGTHRQ